MLLFRVYLVRYRNTGDAVVVFGLARSRGIDIPTGLSESAGIRANDFDVSPIRRYSFGPGVLAYLDIRLRSSARGVATIPPAVEPRTRGRSVPPSRTAGIRVARERVVTSDVRVSQVA